MWHVIHFLILLMVIIGLPFGWLVAWKKPLGKKLQTSFYCGVMTTLAVIFVLVWRGHGS